MLFLAIGYSLFVVVVELFYSLERILLLGGLNHASAIWLERYSNLLRLLSSRPDKTSSAHSGCFVVVTLGASFICAGCVHTRQAPLLQNIIFVLLFWSHLGCLGAPSGALWALLGCSLATRGLLLAAQAA